MVLLRLLQNDDKKKTTAVSQNIASVHPSLNLYHISLVRKNLRILFDSDSHTTFISEKECNQLNLKTVSKQNISVKSFGNNEI